jgi:ATP-dependent RNA helicase DeaD
LTTATLVERPTGFHQLNLSPSLISSLDRAGYRRPTPIQAALIPRALPGTDVIGQAQTGTGKTAAFVLPFLERWREEDQGTAPIALVLAPTRELVVQVCEEARRLSPHPNCRMIPVYGGTKFREQVTALQKGVSLVVGTPGRILDHLSRGTLNFEQVRYLVLDEADRMLDLGFRDDIERILRRCPRDRQTLLLSATLPPPILRLAQRYMRKPIIHINLSPKKVTVEKIRQTYFTVDKPNKFDLLQKVMEREQPRQCIIFCERKIGAQRLYEKLSELHQKVAAMHGDLEQPKRERIMRGFREGKITYLVATDVVGRGIDVMGISHIFNYDLPEDPENYVHRIGRTGRMGKDGIAISFVTPEQGPQLDRIESFIDKLIPQDQVDGFEAFRPKSETIAPEAPKPAPMAVFGRRIKRYSNRL